MRKLDLYLVIEVENEDGVSQELQYFGFANFIEEESTKVKGLHPTTKEINPKVIVDELLTHTEAIDLANDKNLDVIADLLSFFVSNYINKEHMDSLKNDEVLIYATDSETDIIKWCLEITSLRGIRIGYDIIDLTNHNLKIKDFEEEV